MLNHCEVRCSSTARGKGRYAITLQNESYRIEPRGGSHPQPLSSFIICARAVPRTLSVALSTKEMGVQSLQVVDCFVPGCNVIL